MKSYILKLHKQLVAGDKKATELIEKSQNIAKRYKKCNSIIVNLHEEAYAQARKEKIVEGKLLGGIPYSLKDLVSTKGIRTTGGSKFLENYIPPFNASLYEKLLSSGAILTSKSNLDEFGLGGTGTFSAYGIVRNIYDEERITGGSSSGSVNQVASGEVIFSIGSDTGDSVRRPASFLGVVGYKPTYGSISRYGILPYAPSLDTVGIITKKVMDAAIVADEIFGQDPKDLTSIPTQKDVQLKNIIEKENLKFMVLDRMEDFLGINERKAYLLFLKKIKDAGHSIETYKFTTSLINSLDVVYHAISYTEAASCWANLTGIQFGENIGTGTFEEKITVNRTKLLGKEVKRRFVIGAYIGQSDNFGPVYQKSKQARRAIVDECNIIFENHILLLPGASTIAPLINDIQSRIFKSTIADSALLLANFGGFPSITIPGTLVEGMPFGINLTHGFRRDQELLSAALTLESIFGGKDDE